MHEILIYGPIGMGWGVDAESIDRDLANAGGEDVTVRINSGGGGFDEGPAIYNALRRHEGNLTTEVDGIAYSMASMILQAGSPRRMAANSIVMIHGAQSFADGSAEDLRKQAEIMEIHTEAMVSAFTANGIAADTVRGWLQDGEDHYFTAEQALEHGLIDEISDAVDMAAAMSNIPKDIQLPPQLAAYRQQLEEIQMPDENKASTSKPERQAGTIDVTALKASRDKNVQAGLQAGQQTEMRRQNKIRAFFDRPQFSDPKRIGDDGVRAFYDLLNACLGDCLITPDKARDAALDMQDGMPSPIVAVETQTQKPGSSFGKIEAPAGYLPAGRQAIAGADAKEKFSEGVSEALMVKAGVEKDQAKKRKAAENPFLSMSVYELARYHNDLHGIAGQGLQRREAVIGAAITASGIAHSTSDFANILENIANKAMMRGWDESSETWMNWARSGTLPDFKQGSRVNLSTFGDLDLIYENGEYKYGSFSDLKEVLTLGTYGKLFGISRQALANDDLSALSAIPTGMGRAAARKIGDLAYNSLISNPVLNQDSTTVFHANHNNIGTAGVPDVAPGGSIDEAWTAVGLQQDPTGNTLNITPRHILVPKALEISTGSMIADPTFHFASAAQNRANPFQGRLTVTSDARLDTASATAWYVLADQDMYDTVEVAFLNGQETPYLESKEGWSTDGVEYKVRIDAVAVPLDFRTMFYNAGA